MNIIRYLDNPESREILESMFKELERRCPDLYKKTFIKLHEKTYGKHFDDELAHYAVAAMHNVDGTHGEHWSKRQTDSVASQLNVEQLADFYYLMNMFYSDYQNLFGSSDEIYAKMAKAAIEDPDAPEEKWLMTFIWTH